MMHASSMPEFSARRLLLTLGLVMIAAGCGEGEIVEPPLHDLAEPWQARPFAVNPAVTADAELVCRDPMLGMIPPGTSLLLVDARGANRLFLLFGGPAADAQCILDRDAAGRLRSNGGGSSNGPAQPGPGAGEVIVTTSGSQSSMGVQGAPDTINFVVGRAGANVAAVEVGLSTGESLQASLGRGWFAAWWPGEVGHGAVRGYDAGGRPLGTSP
jgi:hypothetical protein